MTRVKVCGLTAEADLGAAVAAGADAVGVVADVPVDSPREVSVDRAASLVAAVPPLVTSVLVTMPDSPGRALELIERVEPDAVQVHGDLPVGDLAFLAARSEARVLAAVDAGDGGRARAVDRVADAVVLDSTGADGGGGTGRTHDWERARDLAGELASPVLLAGGLGPDNVREAVATVEPFGVDVASGVERAMPDDRPGRKDPAAVERFVGRTAAVREVDP